MFWCMGGGAGNLLLGQPGYCDGERYPDGSAPTPAPEKQAEAHSPPAG